MPLFSYLNVAPASEHEEEAQERHQRTYGASPRHSLEIVGYVPVTAPAGISLHAMGGEGEAPMFRSIPDNTGDRYVFNGVFTHPQVYRNLHSATLASTLRESRHRDTEPFQYDMQPGEALLSVLAQSMLAKCHHGHGEMTVSFGAPMSGHSSVLFHRFGLLGGILDGLPRSQG
ncbi:hypothetical protein KIPB_007137, partial [Kipferlia bialata]|eukprot:g7137.t1